MNKKKWIPRIKHKSFIRDWSNAIRKLSKSAKRTFSKSNAISKIQHKINVMSHGDLLHMSYVAIGTLHHEMMGVKLTPSKVFKCDLSGRIDKRRYKRYQNQQRKKVPYFIVTSTPRQQSEIEDLFINPVVHVPYTSELICNTVTDNKPDVVWCDEMEKWHDDNA